MKISVIVPVYNVAEYLPACLESLAAQTHRDLELVLVDDGSTDGSAALLEAFAQREPRAVVIAQPNGGVSAARNRGLDAATGEFVGFVDSDDIADARMFEMLLRTAQQVDADMVECGHRNLSPDGTVLGECPLAPEVLEGRACVHAYLSQRNTRNYCCNKLYRRSLIGDARFSALASSEDFLFNVTVLRHCRRKATVADCLYGYVRHSASVCGQPFHAGRMDTLRAGEAAFALLEDDGLRALAAAYTVRWAMQCYLQARTLPRAERREFRPAMLSAARRYLPHMRRVTDRSVVSRNTLMLARLFCAVPALYAAVMDAFGKQ